MDILELNLEETETKNQRLARYIRQKKGTLQIPACLFVLWKAVRHSRAGLSIDNIEKWRCSIMVNYIKDNKNFTPSI